MELQGWSFKDVGKRVGAAMSTVQRWTYGRGGASLEHANKVFYLFRGSGIEPARFHDDAGKYKVPRRRADYQKWKKRRLQR